MTSNRILVDGILVSLCVGCGFCCIKGRCGASLEKDPPTPICPSLIWNEKDKRHYCNLCLKPGEKGEFYRKNLYIKAGCCSNLNSWRNDVKNRTEFV